MITDLGIVRSAIVRSGIVRSGIVRSGIVRSGIVRSGIVRSGIVRSGIVRPVVRGPGLVRVLASSEIAMRDDRSWAGPGPSDATPIPDSAPVPDSAPRTARSKTAPDRPACPPRAEPVIVAVERRREAEKLGDDHR